MKIELLESNIIKRAVKISEMKCSELEKYIKKNTKRQKLKKMNSIEIKENIF